MATCNTCGGSYLLLRLTNGTCSYCITAQEARAKIDTDPSYVSPPSAKEIAARDLAISTVLLTTESTHNLQIERRIDIVTAEAVIGMHLLKDIAMAVRDTFGGRSKVAEKGLRDLRTIALAELRGEAHALGADAVVGVHLDYSPMTSNGQNMLFLVASGTAVVLAKSKDRA